LASRPFRWTWSTIGASRPPSRFPCTTTFAPSAARRSAVAFPMPRLDPVTTATLPSRRMDGTAARGRAGNAKPLEDGAELGAIIRRKIGERGAHRPGGVAEQLHRGLHDRDREAAAARAQVGQRTDGNHTEPREREPASDA